MSGNWDEVAEKTDCSTSMVGMWRACLPAAWTRDMAKVPTMIDLEVMFLALYVYEKQVLQKTCRRSAENMI